MATSNDNIAKANRSFKWTALAEISAKFIVPLMNMILARLISPAIFGIVASLTVITGFATTLADSGFSRYIQQHQFRDFQEQKKAIKTSMATSLTFGVLIFLIILIFNKELAAFIGASGYEIYLIIAAIAIPLHSITSIELAVLKREFRFKQSSFLRIASTLVMAIIEISLAFLGFGIEALTIGPVFSSLFLVFAYFALLKDKRIFGFSFKSFKDSFSVNSLFIIESLLVWLTSALDIFVLGDAFGEDLVGIYKMAFNTEQGLIAVLTAIFTPVLISLLSTISSEHKEYKNIIFSYQRALAFISVPIGVGLFVFHDVVSDIFLGSSWGMSSIVFACFGLTECIKIPVSNFISVLMISKGKPQGSIIPLVFYNISIIICCLFAKKLGFNNFVIIRATCVLVLVAGYMILCKPFLKLNPLILFKNLLPAVIGSCCMAIPCLLLVYRELSLVSSVVIIFMAATIYFSSMYLFFRKEMTNFLSIIIHRRK